MSARLLAFCLRSLYREYGAAFLLRVVVAHPVATLQGVARFMRGPVVAPEPWQGGLALAICGIEAHLVSFVHGDCRDYLTWRRADRGEKAEQTVLDEAGLRTLTETLSGTACGVPCRQFRRVGNIYEPF